MTVQTNGLYVGQAVPAVVRAVDGFAHDTTTTQYTAGDVVSNGAVTNLMRFPLARQAGGAGYIVKGQLETNSKTFLSQMRLYLFMVPAGVPGVGITVAADNVAATLAYADRGQRVGYLDFPLLATGAGSGSTTSYALWTGNLEFHCNPTDDTLYGYLVDNTGSTPVSGQLFSVKLSADVY